jgi:hypothetical protein
VPRDEVEAAYFTLLRAREEVSALQRYGELLAEESRRLERNRREGQALAAQADRRLWRALSDSQTALDEAIDLRLRVIRDERDRLDERGRAADAYVRECEDAHERLRRDA